MRRVIDYLINSNLTVSFNLNPLRWGFTLEYFGPKDEGGDLQPTTHFWYVKFLCLVVMVIISDGDM